MAVWGRLKWSGRLITERSQGSTRPASSKARIVEGPKRSVVSSPLALPGRIISGRACAVTLRGEPSIQFGRRNSELWRMGTSAPSRSSSDGEYPVVRDPEFEPNTSSTVALLRLDWVLALREECERAGTVFSPSVRAPIARGDVRLEGRGGSGLP